MRPDHPPCRVPPNGGRDMGHCLVLDAGSEAMRTFRFTPAVDPRDDDRRYVTMARFVRKCGGVSSAAREFSVMEATFSPYWVDYALFGSIFGAVHQGDSKKDPPQRGGSVGPKPGGRKRILRAPVLGFLRHGYGPRRPCVRSAAFAAQRVARAAHGGGFWQHRWPL